jgi:hypothetical protein
MPAPEVLGCNIMVCQETIGVMISPPEPILFQRLVNASNNPVRYPGQRDRGDVEQHGDEPIGVKQNLITE